MLICQKVNALIFPVLGFTNPMFREIGIDKLSCLPPKVGDVHTFNLIHQSLFDYPD